MLVIVRSLSCFPGVFKFFYLNNNSLLFHFVYIFCVVSFFAANMVVASLASDICPTCGLGLVQWLAAGFLTGGTGACPLVSGADFYLVGGALSLGEIKGGCVPGMSLANPFMIGGAVFPPSLLCSAPMAYGISHARY